MQISAIGYPNYIYNTNRLSAGSLGKVKAIPEDALQSKVGYENSQEEPQENINPLGLGQSRDLAGILESQMAMSRMNAARLMQPAAEEPMV